MTQKVLVKQTYSAGFRPLQFPDGRFTNRTAYEDYVYSRYLHSEIVHHSAMLLEVLQKGERDRLLEWAETQSGAAHGNEILVVIAVVPYMIANNIESISYLVRQIREGKLSGKKVFGLIF